MQRQTTGARRPLVFHGGLAICLAVVVTLAILASLNWPGGWWPWVGAWLAGINLTTFGFYAYDKFQARRDAGRVPELVLHSLAFVGGSVGALGGMQFFRHKTLKGQFRFVFWLILFMQAGLIAAIGYRLLTWKVTAPV